MSHSSVPNFSLIGVHIWYFMEDFAKCEKKKSEGKTETLAARILEMAGAMFFEFHV